MRFKNGKEIKTYKTINLITYYDLVLVQVHENDKFMEKAGIKIQSEGIVWDAPPGCNVTYTTFYVRTPLVKPLIEQLRKYGSYLKDYGEEVFTTGYVCWRATPADEETTIQLSQLNDVKSIDDNPEYLALLNSVPGPFPMVTKKVPGNC
jgi:hypothetical protein